MTRIEVERMLYEHGARLKPKEGNRFMKMLSFFVIVFTFGKNRRFMDSYWTTIGRNIYWPSRVDDPYRYWLTLKHECKHISDSRRFPVFYEISYLLLPLPFGLAWFRWFWERRAYLYAQIEHATNKEREIERIVDNLWHEYGWTWPKKWMRRWFRERAG